MTRVAVIGGGAWGSALAHLLAKGGHQVRLWAREPDVVQHVNATHANPRFLPGAILHPDVVATESMPDALEGATLIVYVAPSHVFREVVRQGAAHVAPEAIAIVATKGIEPGSLKTMSDVVSAELPRHAVVALSGPSFAIEVAKGMPGAIVAASTNAAAALQVQRAFSSPVFRVYTSDDVVGVELGGAIKNVMAVATGMAEGVGLGLNSRAALITRGLAEMTRLGVSLGARPETFAGLAGMGDLVLTCTGALSRNRSVGVEVGRGRELRDVLAATESVAEGVTTTESARALAAKMKIDMPIVNAVGRILFEGQSPAAAIAELMARDLRAERDA